MARVEAGDPHLSEGLYFISTGTGLILHSIYVKYSHKFKKKKGSKCGDILMVRTENIDFSCKRLTSIEIRKSKYHIIRRVRF